MGFDHPHPPIPTEDGRNMRSWPSAYMGHHQMNAERDGIPWGSTNAVGGALANAGMMPSMHWQRYMPVHSAGSRDLIEGMGSQIPGSSHGQQGQHQQQQQQQQLDGKIPEMVGNGNGNDGGGSHSGGGGGGEMGFLAGGDLCVDSFSGGSAYSDQELHQLLHDSPPEVCKAMMVVHQENKYIRQLVEQLQENNS
jgi:hypothetical protein